MFRFSQLVYPTAEENGPVTVTVELFDRMLTFPIAVTVMDIAGGSATGKIRCGLLTSNIQSTESFFLCILQPMYV